MSSFGERLKRTRENRKLTLDQAATATKIGTRMLKALEEEKFDQLPGGIFNKGFVRSYAKFLGIDEAQAITDYLQASGAGTQPAASEDAELKAIAERKQKERQRQRAQSKGVPWGLTAALLLIICLLLAGWSFYSRDHHSVAPIRPLSAKSTEKSTPAADEAVSSAPVPQPTLTDVSQSSTTAQGGVSAPATAQTDPAVAAFTVQVQAKEDSWLTVTADGKSVFSDTLVAPGTKSFGAQKELVIRAGNAGGLDISFNGEKLPAIGLQGEVKTVTFNTSGMQAPSPNSTE